MALTKYPRSHWKRLFSAVYTTQIFTMFCSIGSIMVGFWVIQNRVNFYHIHFSWYYFEILIRTLSNVICCIFEPPWFYLLSSRVSCPDDLCIKRCNRPQVLKRNKVDFKTQKMNISRIEHDCSIFSMKWTKFLNCASKTTFLGVFIFEWSYLFTVFITPWSPS